jgi:hypothetical protein
MRIILNASNSSFHCTDDRQPIQTRAEPRNAPDTADCSWVMEGPWRDPGDFKRSGIDRTRQTLGVALADCRRLRTGGFIGLSHGELPLYVRCVGPSQRYRRDRMVSPTRATH